MKKYLLSILFLFLSAPSFAGWFGGVTGGSTVTVSGAWTFDDTFYVGTGANISTFTSTAITIDNGNLLTITSGTVNSRFLLGTGTAISTFTATAVTLDDGVTLTNGGTSVFNGNSTFGDAITDVVTFNALFALPQDAAPRTNVTPTVLGQLIINTGATPDEVCSSSGTAKSTWVLIGDWSTPCSN